MRILLSWLNEFLEKPLPVEEISHILTMGGIEVEHTEKLLPRFEGVIAARVIKTEKHPNADKLCIAQVFDGKEHRTVVCGASNCREGLLTAFAVPGSKLYPEGRDKAPFAIKKAKLRGIESEGMLCAEDELGLSDSHEGIIELNSSWKEGDLLQHRYEDVALELGLTPNLAHCFSVMGVARELCSLTGIALKSIFQESKPLKDSSCSNKHSLQIGIEDPELCPRYSCLVIKGVKVGPTPAWMKKRLEACGLRSVNNVVDATNYALLALGHPLHAFDLDKLQGNCLKIRSSKKGEALTTLDGIQRSLPQGSLVIADNTGPVAIAGVMGGQNSEISNETTSIVLESAMFDPKSIRRTAKVLGLSTDASKRFERGCDPHMTVRALQYVYELLKESCLEMQIDCLIDQTPIDFPENRVKCRLSRANLVLGTEISLSEAELVFQRLKFHAVWDGCDIFSVDIPSYRHDIKEEIDLIEEISRVLSLHQRGMIATQCSISNLSHHPLWEVEKELRQWLVSEGLQEFLTCDLISPKMVEVVKDHPIPKENLVKVLNPTSIEQSILRPSLLPGLLEVVKTNIAHQNRDITGFEIGRVHFKHGNDYEEPLVFAILLTGKSQPYHFDSSNAEVDILDLKGIIENVLGAYGWQDCVTLSRSTLPIFHPGRQAKYEFEGLQIGVIGELHPQLLRQFDINQRVYFAEFNVQDLLRLPARNEKLKDLPLFPGSERDWTLTILESVSIGEIINSVYQVKSNLLEGVSLQAIYRNEKLGTDLKNVTLHFNYRNRAKTLSQEEVDREHSRIVDSVSKSLPLKKD